MKKIGIITYHHYDNFGTMLQAFALQKQIEELGYDVELIDFKQNTVLPLKKNLLLHIKRIPVYLKNFKKYYVLKRNKQYFEKRVEFFEVFYKERIKVGKDKYSNSEQLMLNPPRYDAYIVGSDQTWNPYVANRPEAFYLSFVDDDSKKGSYGPSIAVGSLDDEQKGFIKERLANIRYISCREESGARLLEGILNRPVKNVLDPTLLLKKNLWETIMEQKPIVKEKYIFVYFLGDVDFHREFLKDVSKQLGYRIVSMSTSYKELCDSSITTICGGPYEFLNLINNAELVCTDSFHGSMFSINFGKNFYSMCKTSDVNIKSENSRILCALEMFGLSNRLITSCDHFDINDLEIDYKKVNDVLALKREDSLKYLIDMLEDLSK